MALVAFPLLSAGTLDGRSEEIWFSLGLVVLPIVATPWGYVYLTFFRRDRGGRVSRGLASEPSYEAASS